MAGPTSVTIHPIDLEHDGLPGAISTYFVDGPEPTVVDPGPATTLDALEAGLAERGLPLTELRHVVLTHVHLDHAGAAGALAARVRGVTVHVHEDGAPHMADPARLVASTRRTFGDAHDRLWGVVQPVPADRIRGWRPGDPSPLGWLRPFHTPGHIDHHVAWLCERTGTLLAGDALGIVLAPGAPTHPPTPPPSLDVEAWRATLRELEPVGPERIGVAHFGLHDDFRGRRQALDDALVEVVHRVRAARERGGTDADAEAYEEEVRERQAAFRPRDEVDRYFEVFRAATDYRGVERYLNERTTDTRAE